MSAEDMVAETFGKVLSEEEMRAVVYLVAASSKSKKYTDVSNMGYWDCVKWIEEHSEQTKERLRKIIAYT